MRKRGLWLLITAMGVFLSLCLCTQGRTQQLPQVVKGIDYLSQTQNQDGSWGSDTGSADYLPATAEVTRTFALVGVTGATYTNGLAWIGAQSLDTTDYLSQRIGTLRQAGTDAGLLVSFYNTSRTAWGGDGDHDADTLDTASALFALRSVNYSDQITINSALAYLLATQNTDGGWAFNEGDGSSIYMTAMVMTTLEGFPQTAQLANAVNKAGAYLISCQHNNGSFGSSYETALAYIALVAVTTDTTVLGNASNYLLIMQNANGSWDNDPYSTALALRALYFSQNKPVLPPAPDKGTISGQVIDVATNAPLQGVIVVVEGTTLNTVTDSAGAFSIALVPMGSATVSFALAGYATGSATVTISGGSLVNLGSIKLSANPTTGMVKGVVTDKDSGQSLPNVTVAISGAYTASVTTEAKGTFSFAGVTPGMITITASLTGYNSASGTGTVTAGGTIIFNPVLSTSPPSTTTGILTGRVFDGVTKQAIFGASIVITGGATASTDSQGSFTISDITPNTYQATISAPGYGTQTYQFMITAGITTDAGTIYLSPASQSTTITGRVTDAATNNPISGATVTIHETGQTTKSTSDGTYVISGISLLDFNVRAQATGYNSVSRIISVQGAGSYAVDFQLYQSVTGALKLVTLVTDNSGYAAYSTVSIQAEVLNESAAAMTGTSIGVTIENEEGEVVDIFPVTRTDGNGTVHTTFDFEPGQLTPVTILWDTGNRPPGNYNAIVKVSKSEEAAYLSGNAIMAERAVNFAIDPTEAIASLVLKPLPRFANLDEVEQIAVLADLINHSNVQTALSFSYEWRSPGGLVLHTGTATVSLLPGETTKSVSLEAFPFTFAESGGHPVVIQGVTGPQPASLVGEAILVAPGIRVEPSQNLTPPTVTPDGDKRIRINIELKGVEVK